MDHVKKITKHIVQVEDDHYLRRQVNDNSYAWFYYRLHTMDTEVVANKDLIQELEERFQSELKDKPQDD